MLIFYCRLLKINYFFAKIRKCSLLSYHYRDSRGHHATCKSRGTSVNTQEERAENHLHFYIFCCACWKGLLRLNGKVQRKFLILIVSLCFTIEISPNGSAHRIKFHEVTSKATHCLQDIYPILVLLLHEHIYFSKLRNI